MTVALMATDGVAAAALWVGGCGPGANYASIQAAVDASANGDTVKICAGEYNEQVTVPPARDGLTIEGATGNRDDVKIWHNNATIRLDGGNTTLRHLTVESINGRGIVRGWTASPTPHQFENLVIRAKEEALYVDTSTKITVKRVKAQSSNNRAIFIYNATNGAHEFEDIEVTAKETALWATYGGVTYKNIVASSQNSDAIYLQAYYDVFFQNIKAKGGSKGIHLDWSPSQRNIRFSDVEVDAVNEGIRVVTANQVSMARVSARSTNADAIRIESQALGPHEFEDITVTGAAWGKWGLYSYTGGLKFKNITIGTPTEKITGGGIYLRPHFPARFATVRIYSSAGEGIRSEWASSRQALAFNDIEIDSQSRCMTLEYGGEVQIQNAMLTSRAEGGIFIGDNVPGDHRFSNVVVTSNKTALQTNGGGVLFKQLQLRNDKGEALIFKPRAASPTMVFEDVLVRSRQDRGVVGLWGASYSPPPIEMRRIDLESLYAGIWIEQSAAVTIENSTIRSFDQDAIYLQYNASGSHLLRNLTLYAGAGKSGVRMESGIGQWSTTSPLLDRVCVTTGKLGVWLSNWNARRVRIQNSRFDVTEHGVKIESDPSGTSASQVAGSCFMKPNAPRAWSNDARHRFDGNYWQGVAGGSVYVDGNVRDPATLSSCPVSSCEAVVPSLHHLRIEAGGTGLTCQRETVTFKACANADCSSLYTGGDVTINLSPAGQWFATATGGSALPNPQTIPTSGLLTLYLQQTMPAAAAVNAAPFGGPAPSGNPAVTCNNDATAAPCSIVFADAGLIFSDSPSGSEITIPNQTAGILFSHYLRAVKSDKTTGACVAAIQGSRSVTFSYACLDPSPCAPGTYLAVNGGALTQNLTFDASGATPVQFNYRDVGRIKLSAKTLSDTGAALTGESNPFVVKPHHFELSDVRCDDGTPNPAAFDANGGKFCRAGEDFTLNVSARESGGGVTPSYGREAAPETVGLSSALVTGIGLSNNPRLSGSFDAFGTKCDGSSAAGWACGTFKWDEVGIITLTPAVKDGDYLGAGNVTGASSGNVGRFYPHHFDTTVTSACGSFTYSGQPFPLTVTAKNLGGGTTQNYAGAFAKTVTLSDANGATGAFSPASLAAGDFLAGEANKSVKFTFAGKPAAPATLKVRATDGEASSASGSEGSLPLRSGRLRLVNYYGSELLRPRVEYRVEYWDGSRWTVNAADTCTSLAAANIATGGLAAPSVGALFAGIGFITFNTAPAGSYDIAANLNAAGSDTSCNAAHGGTAANLPWLQGDWSASCGGIPPWQQDPNARVRLGSPKAPYIYLRERY